MSGRLGSLRVSLVLAALIPLCFAAIRLEGRDAPAHPTRFDFSGRLSSSKMRGLSKTLRAGALLQAFDPATPDLFYQPVVLCEPVEVHFKADGVSEPIHFKGFCYGPGNPVPPGISSWRVTGVLVLSLLKSMKCTPEQAVATRAKEMKPPPPMLPHATSIPCMQSETECRKEFDVTVQRTFNKSLRQAEDDGTCTTEYGRSDYRLVLYLKCLPPAQPARAPRKVVRP
jgi:hypothetical protein